MKKMCNLVVAAGRVEHSHGLLSSTLLTVADSLIIDNIKSVFPAISLICQI